MKEATTELLNQKRIKEILKSGGAKTVSAEAVAWIGAVAREAAKNLAQSGRRTPGGRLMAPKFAPSLMARQAALPPEPALGEGDLVVQEAIPAQASNIYETIAELVTGAAPGSLAGIKQTNPDLYCKVKAGVLAMQCLPPAEDPDESGAVWSEYNDWQTAVKRGETKLPFEEWKKEKGK